MDRGKYDHTHISMVNGQLQIFLYQHLFPFCNCHQWYPCAALKNNRHLKHHELLKFMQKTFPLQLQVHQCNKGCPESFATRLFYC